MTGTPRQRHRPGGSASVVEPPRWRVGGACTEEEVELDQKPHRLEMDYRDLVAGLGLTV